MKTIGNDTSPVSAGQSSSIESKVDIIDASVDLLTDSISVMSSLRADTAVLFVSPNGDDSDGSSWSKAYNTLQGALNAASTDGDDLTLIFVSPHETEYDINTAGDPTWTGNYVIKGSHRQWAKITNNHASATSIMKFTGKVALSDLNINLGTSVNGVIVTKGGFRIDDCFFNGEDLTSPATAIHADGATAIKNGKIRGCDIKGEATSTHMTGILLDNAECADIIDTRIGYCVSGLQQVGANSNLNRYKNSEFCTCAIGANIDEGTAISFDDVLFYQNTLNIDDEVGGHIFKTIRGSFPISTEPDDFTGVAVNTGDGADTWTASPVEIRAAATATKPFKIVGLNFEIGSSEKYRIRLSADNGSTWFDDFQIEDKKNQALSFSTNTDFIFNAGTQITAESKSESAGVDNLNVWLKIQEI